MKANRKFKCDIRAEFGMKESITLVALLLTIIVGVLVYFSITDNIDQFDNSYSVVFTTDSDGNSFTMGSGSTLTTSSNYTGEMIELDNTPSSVTNITCYNSTAASESWATTQGSHYKLNGRYLTIVADTTGATVSQYDQLNVSYDTILADSEADATSTAETVFTLAPVIAIVMVASVILFVVLSMGKGGKRF